MAQFIDLDDHRRPSKHRRHPDWIRSYLNTVVPKSEAPERFHFWVAASIIAGALRRRVYIDMEAFRWYPNLFVVLVGPPGTVKKSTTINVGARLLRDVPNINFGSDVNTWEGFITEVEEAKDWFAEGDTQKPLSLDDEVTASSAITLVISEWGTFLDPQNYNMINMLTELYDGKSDIPLKKNTKTQGTNTIINPFVNMITGTTPDWMRDNFKGKFGGWGFSSRCVFLHCLEPERLVPYPDEQWRGTFKSQMNAFLADLIQISQLQGQYELTPEARIYGRDWYTQHMQRKVQLDRHPDHDPWLSYYLARKFDHAHKLAMVLAASRGNDLVVRASDLRDACTRCDEVELELAQVFGSRIESTRSGKLYRDVWRGLQNILVKMGPLNSIQAGTFVQQFMTYGEAKAFFDHCIANRMLRAEVEDGTTQYILITEQEDVPIPVPPPGTSIQ